MKSAIKVQRARAEHLGGSKVKFYHPCGHTSTKDYAKGPRSKQIQEMGVKFLVRYWGRTGGVIAPCKRCLKELEKGK